MTRPAPPSHPAASSPAPEHDTSRPTTAMPPLDAWMYRQQSSGGSNMTAALLAWFEGPPPTLSALRSLAEYRLAPYERLRQMPSAADSTDDSWPLWSTGPHFEAAHHVVESPGAATTELEVDIAALFTAPLAPGRPPWQLHLIPTTGGFVLLLRAHHALLDGRSIATLLRALFDETAALRPPRVGGAATVDAPSRARQLVWTLGDLLPKARPLPFHGPVDPFRVLSFRQVSRQELDAARASTRSAPSAERASTNAVFLAATAGALRTQGVTGRSLPTLPGICALVPVDVRTNEESQLLGNHYATVRVPLPRQRDARERLAAVDCYIRRAAIGARARAQAAVVSSRPRKITPLSNAAGRYVDSPRYFSLLCSSVSTHAGELTLGSARLTAMAALPPLGPGHPVAVTAIHHGSTSVVTAITDHNHRDLAQPLAERIHDEIRVLADPNG
ncbi:wax ester/triacylglycerol synthase family O-acyltransferase [Streptomyces longhuiensis]|uniref:wax ester/triacylglycerol synthase family O-acyltransferase n=1 Tax=Streptomyces longhuiensis TaxID=2880933 RepID=UPI001D0AF413|nr:wax ester/triacylglycerol synthase family O-acyltransferase [Streptomyces longhuiensis]UDM04226.1 wax ester/triacylglycerol synthase family O-acyltransferase [Streptomyces longhuiensis]